MKRLQKLCCIFAVLLLALLPLAIAGQAQESSCATSPVIVVNGMAAVPLMRDGTQVYMPDIAAALPQILCAAPQLLQALSVKDWDAVCDAILPIAYDLFEPAAYGPDGSSKYPLTLADYPQQVPVTPDEADGTGELARLGNTYAYPLARVLPEGHVYNFASDWRMSPIENAALLQALVTQVKQETGHEKVTLIAASLGGTITLAYLDQFGHADLDKMIFLSCAHNGTQFIGDMYTGNFATQSDALRRYLVQMLPGGALAKGVWAALATVLQQTGLLDALLDVFDEFVSAAQPRVFAEFFLPTFGQYAGMIALMPPSMYPAAREFLYSPEIHSGLLAKTDAYYEISLRREALLNAAIADGVIFAVTSHYNRQGLPYGESCCNHNDNLIDTVYTSGGATIAPLGKTLGKKYVQAKDCGHNHLSTDGIIDASTAMFPEYTWFFKDAEHVNYPKNSGLFDFLCWLLDAKEQVTVHSDPRFPQFSKQNADLSLSSLTGKPPAKTAPKQTAVTAAAKPVAPTAAESAAPQTTQTAITAQQSTAESPAPQAAAVPVAAEAERNVLPMALSVALVLLVGVVGCFLRRRHLGAPVDAR